MVNNRANFVLFWLTLSNPASAVDWFTVNGSEHLAQCSIAGMNIWSGTHANGGA